MYSICYSNLTALHTRSILFFLGIRRVAVLFLAVQRPISKFLIIALYSATTEDCERLYKALRTVGTTYQLSDSACLVCTKRSVAEVALEVEATLESDDRFYLAPLTYIDYLPEHARVWIATQQYGVKI